MKSQFVKITTIHGGVVWVNVAHIVEVKPSRGEGQIVISTDSCDSEGKGDYYVVKGSVEDFFDTLGIKPISFE